MIVVGFIMAMREEVPAYASSRTLMLYPRRVALAHSRAFMLYTEVDVMSESWGLEPGAWDLEPGTWTLGP